MKNLLRAIAVCALVLTALSTVEAFPYGTCRFRCFSPNGPKTSVTISLTQAECCGGDLSQYCPPGYSAFAPSWNFQLCGVGGGID